MIKIAIMEDDIQELKNLKECINKYFADKGLEYHIEVLTSSKEIVQRSDSFDIIFLDIQLSDNQNGVDIGIAIRKKNKDIKIIFVTNYLEYSIEGYKAKADRYFIKPISQENFNLEMDNVIESYLSQFAGFIDEKISTRKICYQHIMYVEFLNRKTYLHLTTGEVLTTPYPLKYWKEKLESLSFSQPYKSIIVNLNQISGFTKTDLILIDNKILPISKNFKKTFEQDYLHNIHKRI